MSVETRLERLLTVQEICELLQVPISYIYSLTHRRMIPYIKIHGHLRFRQSDIADWLESKEVRGNVSIQEEV